MRTTGVTEWGAKSFELSNGVVVGNVIYGQEKTRAMAQGRYALIHRCAGIDVSGKVWAWRNLMVRQEFGVGERFRIETIAEHTVAIHSVREFASYLPGGAFPTYEARQCILDLVFGGGG